MRIAIALACTLALAGCSAGVSRSMSYNHIKHTVFEDPALPHPFWIFDKPADQTMLVNVGVGAAFGQGVAKGATLGLANASTAHQHFEKAAQLFLDRAGRPCTVDRSERILGDTNYEVFYTCQGN